MAIQAAQRALRGIFEPTRRHIRVVFGGETIADSKRAMLLRDSGYDLHYLFPLDDVRMGWLEASDFVEKSAYKGEQTHWTVQVGEHRAENAAWAYPNAPVHDRPDLRGYIGFVWDAMDHWYEEDEEIFVHPRDPYHRVDTIKSKRHIKVVVEGEVVAETERPYLLFETNLPTRYYIPLEDVNPAYLTPTDLHTACPYKGVASYWSINVKGKTYANLVWAYPNPIAEIPKIKGTVAFYNEKLDIYVDGELEERPKTVWS
ncbi:MAG: DUF427 domain-containing protein [Anaerolineaceae bacterium]|nr:DUF427 domain-containing protein [Anaerolineaceae bacterium]